MRPNKIHYIFILFFVSAILYYFFFKIIQNPSAYITSTGGDGLKNYFTFAYHLKHGNGWHFSGMNYPYGDLILFTDNHPILAFIFSYLRDWFPNLVKSPVAIINIAMIWTIPLSCFCLFNILLRFKLPVYWAISGALLITLVSPQFHRFIAHMSLGYVCFIPTVWLLAIKIKDYQTIKDFRLIATMIGLVFCLVFFSYIHLYYMLIGCLFVLTFGFFELINPLERFTISVNKNHLLVGKILMMVGVIALLISFLSINSLDTITDRVKTPWGFFSFYATFSSIFFPPIGWIDGLIDKYEITAIQTDEGEHSAFVGFWGIWVLVGSVLILFRKLIFKKSSFLILPATLANSLLAAIVLLLFSFCVPFIWLPESFSEKIPYLMQFRSLGRFAWVFYYVFGVYMVYFLYNLIAAIPDFKKSSVLKYACTILVLGIWAIDANMNLLANTKPLFNPNVYFNEDDTYSKILKSINKKSTDYQAILALPFFHLGSEKTTLNGSVMAVTQSFVCAYQTGLPIIDLMGSRSSVSQLLNTHQIVSDTLAEKTFFNNLPNKKPILLMKALDMPIYPSEQYLIDNYATFLMEVKGAFQLYELDVTADFQKSRKKAKENYSLAKPIPNSSFLSLAPVNGPVVYESFEQHNSGYAFRGKGALTMATKAPNTIWKGPLDVKSDSVKIKVSAWFKLSSAHCCMPIFKLKALNEQGLPYTTELVSSAPFSTDRRGWIHQAIDVWVFKTHPKLEVELDGYFEAVDDLWIQPAESTIFKDVNNKIICNNFDLD